MQTKACPPFPIPTWPLGNCLISNFVKAPEGRELCYYKLAIRSSRVYSTWWLIFSTVNLLSGHVRATAGCQALPPLKTLPSAYRNVPEHVLQPRDHSQGGLEGERIWKNRNCPACRKTCVPATCRRTNQTESVQFLGFSPVSTWVNFQT